MRDLPAIFFCLFSIACPLASAQSPYGQLLEEVSQGATLDVDAETLAVILDDGATKSRLSGVDMESWLAEILTSPDATDRLQNYQQVQFTVLNWLATVDRQLPLPKILKKDMFRFFCKHLTSPAEIMWNQAFDRMRHHKLRDNRLEEAFDDPTRTILLAFARRQPTYGLDDRFWGFQNILGLLGMSGAGKEAIDFLQGLDGQVPELEWSRRAAIARLGDPQMASRLVREYSQAKDLYVKARLASVLGYVSTPEALEVLAADLRHDGVMSSEEGFNQYVLAGLSLAPDYPRQDAFFLDMGVYEKKDFDQAEAYARNRFGTEWDVPPPPVRTLKPQLFQ